MTNNHNPANPINIYQGQQLDIYNLITNRMPTTQHEQQPTHLLSESISSSQRYNAVYTPFLVRHAQTYTTIEYNNAKHPYIQPPTTTHTQQHTTTACHTLHDDSQRRTCVKHGDSGHVIHSPTASARQKHRRCRLTINIHTQPKQHSLLHIHIPHI